LTIFTCSSFSLSIIRLLTVSLKLGRGPIQGVTTMADWRKLALTAILADGKIDDQEVKLLKKELYADKTIDLEEMQFLVDLRSAAQKKLKGQPGNPKFDSFFFKAMEDCILKDGVISAEETRYLEAAIFADKKVDAGEVKFLTRLKKAAKQTCPEFEALFQKCTAKK
jgi:hypothetical protein